ncbi:MAG: hypothetical protein KDA65_11160, partial [Planctomycetaceae bacterium]|nr:hypothetical protein [Planctomycetaceae bacterium]
MMTLKRIALCLFLNLALLPGLAQAHFVWLLSQPSEGNESQIQLYFGELAEADDPSLLDNVASAQLWQMDTTGKKIDLTTSRGDESITATPIMKT